MILYGLEPRLADVEIHPVSLINGNKVLVVRIPRSWIAPHRVTCQGHNGFYARDTNGKHPRLSAGPLSCNQNKPVVRETKSRTAAYTASVAALGCYCTHQLRSERVKKTRAPAPAVGGSARINLDGVVIYSDAADGITMAYTQLYRNGGIESVRVIQGPFRPINEFPSSSFERWVIDATKNYLSAQQQLGVTPPVYVFFGIANTGNFVFPNYDGRRLGRSDREDIELGECTIEDLADDPTKILRPLFDRVWQAFGLERSSHRGEGQHSLQWQLALALNRRGLLYSLFG